VSTEWFSRFGDIPRIGYVTPSGITRAKLKRASARPEIVSYGGGERSLSWRTREGSSSASPVRERSFDADVSGKSTAVVLRDLYETLELPGQVGDYHFAIQFVLEELWKRRRAEPAVMDEVERLAWMDVNLIRVRPDTITNEYVAGRPDQPRFYGVAAFGRLITLYEREGALREALEVAEFAAHFEQHEAKRDALVERLTALVEE
jgi:hypothetical protein